MKPIINHKAFTFFILIFLIGRCTIRNLEINNQPQDYKFHVLNITHNKIDGSKDWELTSPEATYEDGNKIVRTKKPEAIIFTGDKPSLNIKSNLGIIYNNGSKVYLSGNVRISQVNSIENFIIFGDELNWIPNNGHWTLNNGYFKSKSISRSNQSVESNSISIKGNNIRGNTLIGNIKIDNCIIYQNDQLIKARTCSWDIINEKLLAIGKAEYIR